jgi:hypothetical protein
MTLRTTNRRKFSVGAAAIVLAFMIVATPARRHIAVSAVLDSAEIAEGVARFPCWLLDRSRLFSLDRLDPTCPQCN